MLKRMRGIGSNQWKHIISTISNITSHSLETHLLLNRYEYDERVYRCFCSVTNDPSVERFWI